MNKGWDFLKNENRLVEVGKNLIRAMPISMMSMESILLNGVQI